MEQARRPPHVGDVLLPVAGAARHARNLVTQGCLQWRLPWLVGSACLVTSELVSNAVVHAGTMIDVTVVRGRYYLLIVVGDGNPAVPVRLASAGAGADHGRGLLVVEAVAVRWGCWQLTGRQQGPGGKVVWAALRILPPAP